MNTGTSSFGTAVTNPYKRKYQQKNNELLVQNKKSNVASTATTTKNMGLQSQRENGSIKKCLKKGTKTKNLRKDKNTEGFSNPSVFIPHLHCKICRLRAQGKKIPKRSHHAKCPRNRATRGLINPSTNTVKINKFYEEREKNNNTLYLPGRDKVDYSQKESNEIKNVYFKPGGSNIIYQPPDPSITIPTKIKFGTSKHKPPPSKNSITTTKGGPLEFRKALDDLVGSYKKSESYEWVKESQFSPELTLAAYQICLETRHKKQTSTSAELPDSEQFQEALERFQYFFKPGTCTHHFLPDHYSNDPSPNYHAIVGESLIYLDWKLIAPQQKLLCYNCKACGADRELTSSKTNFLVF